MPPLSLQEQAYRAIRARIVTCRFPPGSSLVEAQVAEALNFGRTPVRQAFDRLRQEGLVVIHPRKRVEVRGIDPAELLDIIEARLINEGHAARLAAARASPAEIAALEDNVLRAGSATAVAETEQLMLLEQEFHGLIAAAARNAVLADILRNLRDRAIRFWFIAAGQSTHRQSVVAQHAEIVAAIAGRDGAAAEGAMRRHIEDLRSSVQQQG
ncbi:GntR family transcriptional regulator [Roseomonas sp. 18066]|uniref:GntR family transcriptional regulator n=1 Tax=Roseomonas sp. 18066 TaxID=2681412 RepID=UPI00135695E5|nr:GntR family transcriptional regulator [Roseomonas sp. 18066]